MATRPKITFGNQTAIIGGKSDCSAITPNLLSKNTNIIAIKNACQSSNKNGLPAHLPWVNSKHSMKAIYLSAISGLKSNIWLLLPIIANFLNFLTIFVFSSIFSFLLYNYIKLKYLTNPSFSSKSPSIISIFSRALNIQWIKEDLLFFITPSLTIS